MCIRDRNLYHRAKAFIQWIILPWYCDVTSRKILRETFWDVGVVSWQCAKTCITHYVWVYNFYKYVYHSPLPLFIGLSPCDFFLFLKWKLSSRETIGNSREDYSKGTAGCAEKAIRKWPPAVFLSTKITMGPWIWLSLIHI